MFHCLSSVSFWLLTHWRAVIISHLPMHTASLTLWTSVGSVPSFFLPCMHFAFCIDEQWIGWKWIWLLHRKSNRCVTFNVSVFPCVCMHRGQFFNPLHGKIAGKTIQFSCLVSWTTVCRMEMIDNVLFSFTWNTISPSLADSLFFHCVCDNRMRCRCHYLQQFPLMLLPNTHTHTQYHAKQRIKSRRYMKLIPSNSAKRLHLAHFLWKSGCGRYLHHHRRHHRCRALACCYCWWFGGGCFRKRPIELRMIEWKCKIIFSHIRSREPARWHHWTASQRVRQFSGWKNPNTQKNKRNKMQCRW